VGLLPVPAPVDPGHLGRPPASTYTDTLESGSRGAFLHSRSGTSRCQPEAPRRRGGPFWRGGTAARSFPSPWTD